MTSDEILFSRFAEPAIIFTFDGKDIISKKINRKYLNELGINIAEKEFEDTDILGSLDENNLQIYLTAINKCIAGEERAECITWRKLVSNCCGEDTVCIKSNLELLESGEEGYVFFEAIRNVTAIQRNMLDLREGERRFKLAAEQVNVYFWEYTFATREMRPCYRCMRDLGLPALVTNYPEPLFEMGIMSYEFADMYRDWLKQLENGRKELEGDIPLTVGRIPFHFRYTTEFDENGKPYKAFGSAAIVPESELSRIKLDNSIIETLAEEYSIILLADIEHDEMKVLKLGQLSLDKAVFDNKSFTQTVKQIAPAFTEEYGESIETYADLDYLAAEFFKNGDRRENNFKNKKSGNWGRVTFQAVEKRDEIVTKVLITYTRIDDLLARKMDDDRLIADQKRELEERQQKLIEAVDTANKANRAKSDFLARMSHEIRTPMNAIMGMNEIILKSAADETIKGYAGDAYRAATGLLGIINEILDFSKIESGKMELVPAEYSYGNMLADIYTMFAMRTADKDLTLIFKVDETLPSRLLGDETRVRQIITNILSNSVKYTDKGTITFSATKESCDADSVFIRYEISDTGRGIKPEDMEHLFKEFERIDEKNNKNIEGTGLGMSIVSKLIGMMDSELKVESVYGEGSKFSFVLKQQIVDAKPVGDYRNSLDENPNADSRPLFVNPECRVLVVDDDVINLKVIGALLQETQMRVVRVTSGEAALRACAQKKFDLIFMDHYMPEMDGIETLQLLKEQTEGPNADTPVIALTANAIKGAAEEYKGYGFTDVVFKPAGQGELNDILWKYLS